MKLIKIVSFVTGLLTLAWQVIQIMQGNGKNMFLIPDIILGTLLVLTAMLHASSKNKLWLIGALGYACGVFATATFGGLLTNTYDFGALTTTIGLVPCAASIVWLVMRWKNKE